MTEHLPTIRLGVDAAMATLIWLVQLVIYPAFRFIEADRFIAWHHKYTQAIAYVVLPLMIAQAACIGWLCLIRASVGNVTSAGAVLAAWIVTFTLSVPCHHKLQQQGKDPQIINRLVRTNWLRTIAWNIVLLAGALSLRP
ncbi:MAG: hypothetical protein KJN98_01410 [Pontiella sp.]|nr:hypothetical protein [Pontiella sp.]